MDTLYSYVHINEYIFPVFVFLDNFILLAYFVTGNHQTLKLTSATNVTVVDNI